MIWHVSIKLRTSKDFRDFFKSVVAGVFAFQSFMWHFLVSSHGVFVNISNGDNSIKTLLSIMCNLRAVERGCREDIKKNLIAEILIRFVLSLFLTRRVLLQVFLRFLLHYTLSRCLLQKQVCLQNVVKSKIPPSAIGWTGTCSCSINIADEGIKTGSLSVSFSFSRYYGGVIKQYRFL